MGKNGKGEFPTVPDAKSANKQEIQTADAQTKDHMPQPGSHENRPKDSEKASPTPSPTSSSNVKASAVPDVSTPIPASAKALDVAKQVDPNGLKPEVKPSENAVSTAKAAPAALSH